MKISTEIGSIAQIAGEKAAIEYVARAGFDAYDLTMTCMVDYNWERGYGIAADHPLAKSDYVKYIKELRDIAESNGIHCNQSHAPFPVSDKTVFDYLKRAIECTALAGGEICVIHPNNNESAEKNAEMYFGLLPFAKECGVKIATENMWNWDPIAKDSCPAACSSPDSFRAHINAVNDPYFVACLDIGHAEMRGVKTSAHDMIMALGNHLQALHIHDNNLISDLHALPFSMNIDFNSVAKALKAVNYKGYLTLEADKHLQNHTAENCFLGVCEMAKAAKRFRDLLENI